MLDYILLICYSIVRKKVVKMSNQELKLKQKQEALKRMRMLQIMPNVIKDFEKNNKVYYSERQNSFFLATLYWLDNHKEYVDLVKDFEKTHNAIVYHAQLTHLTFGDCLSLFYVSENEEEWSMDKDNISNGEMISYVANLDDDDCSEFGYIGVKPAMGGVVRTW